VDGLTDEERIEAWKSAWQVSLTGMAIVDKDFNFHRVNNQWVKMLGVPASEFYGKSFSDITPPDIRAVDEAQAQLVIDGKINSYLMHKSYEFQNGVRRDVTLLVTRIPMEENASFQYFLSRILLRTPMQNVPTKNSTVSSSPQTLTQNTFEFLFKYGKWIAGLGVFFGALVLKYKGLL